MDSVVGKTTEGAITIIGGGKRLFLLYLFHTFLLGVCLVTNELFGPIKNFVQYLQVTRQHVQPSGTPKIKSAMCQPVEEHLSNC